jgi:protein-S-isoprenylcysteine O-methyltransferase Ste14
MIALKVTAYLKKRLGDGYRYYRLVYNIAAIGTLIPLLGYGRPLKEQVLFVWGGPLLVIKITVLALAVALFILGAMKYDMLSFAGIRQIRSGNHYAVMSETGKIDASGILGLTRHPWYLGAILLVWSDDSRIYGSTLIVNAILTLYIVWGTILEERKLVIEIGDAYRDYQKRVPMLLPLKLKGK